MSLHDHSPGYAPGQEIGYTQITTTASVTSTTESSGSSVLAPGALAFDGGPVIVTFEGLVSSPSTATDYIILSLFEASTQITRLLEVKSASNTSENIQITAQYRFTPTAGLHTYTVTGFVSANNGTPGVIAGSGGTNGFAPAFIRFTKV